MAAQPRLTEPARRIACAADGPPLPLKRTGRPTTTTRRRTDMTHRVEYRYRARDGTLHAVLARRRAGGWAVVDTTASVTVVVERLTESADGAAQALALARDYAAEQHAFQRGARDHDPLARRAPVGAEAGRCAA
jgi:hypothetical protein